MGDEEVESDLVMKFVVVESAGGSLDDKAFVAGCNFARHHMALLACPEADSWSDWVIPEMVPQYDLLAMDLGYVMTTEACPHEEDDCYVRVIFTRPIVLVEGTID